MHEEEAKQHVQDGTPMMSTRDEFYGAMIRFSNIMKQTAEQLEGTECRRLIFVFYFGYSILL